MTACTSILVLSAKSTLVTDCPQLTTLREAERHVGGGCYRTTDVAASSRYSRLVKDRRPENRVYFWWIFRKKEGTKVGTFEKMWAITPYSHAPGSVVPDPELQCKLMSPEG